MPKQYGWRDRSSSCFQNLLDLENVAACELKMASDGRFEEARWESGRFGRNALISINTRHRA